MSLNPAQLAYSSKFYDLPPTGVSGDSAKSWISRGANFVVTVTAVNSGDVLCRNNLDEYVLIIPDTAGLNANIEAGGLNQVAAQDSLSIIPPGESRIEFTGSGLVVRVFSSDATDLINLAENLNHYIDPNPDIAPLVAWPDPIDGFKIRYYKLSDYSKGDSNMRVFRTAKLMINPLLKRVVPRDITKLSPHQHIDFEQGSLAMSGTYIHHMRYPWGPDLNFWHADEAIELKSPSLQIIPPKVLHTSRNIGDEHGYLIDIFAPPRVDFTLKNIVCNASEYPLPQELVDKLVL
jgi:mannose-6-phosphate isomerase-like protein (cupin superfamily)